MNIRIWVRSHLIPNWCKAWRFASMQAMALAIIVQASWQMLDGDMRASLQPGLVQGLTIGLLVLGIAGRLIMQPKARTDD